MAGIVSADLKMFRALVNSDDPTNGGGISSNRITSNVAENLLPNVSEAERITGLTRYRKLFCKNEADLSDATRDGLALVNHRICVGRQSPGDDWLRLGAGTNTDTQAAIGSVPSWHGCGKINANIAADSTSIALAFDGPSGGPYDGVDDGALIRLAEYEYNDSQGIFVVKQEEYVRAIPSGAVSWISNVATILLSTATRYSWNAYTLGPTHATSYYTFGASCVELGDTQADKAIVSQTGPATFIVDNVYVYNIGSIVDTWTITFTSSTAFTVSGAATGALPPGNKSSAYYAINGSSYYFYIPTDAWGAGSWVAGNQIVFTTSQSAKGVWVKEIIPANSASESRNDPHLNQAGESA